MTVSASITQLNDGIIAIDTEYARPLQDASHLIVESGKAAFVDTGANNAVPLLLDALDQQGLDVADVATLFLTHVHLDHAGGAGLLMQKLPNARCGLPPRGAPHMIDPSKLIAGTEAVYGKDQTREIYGEILPIDEGRIDVAEDGQWFELNGRKLQTLFTEGHAKHHYVLNDPTSRGVFTGDSFGISYRETDTANGAIIFPTTTPIDFDPDEAHKSVDRIMACNPDYVYVTHYSRVEDLERLAADMHQCIDDYVAIALQVEQANDAAGGDLNDRQQALEEKMFDYMYDRLARHGFKGDREIVMSIMKIDVVLNSQGLNVWLSRRKKGQE
jgi:glyoxylase-like metal-dependent hydrolase (beta-lactamase superfamily II)